MKAWTSHTAYIATDNERLNSDFTNTVKPVKNGQIGFQDQISLNAGQKYYRGEHSAILLTFIKLPFVIKIFILFF